MEFSSEIADLAPRIVGPAHCEQFPFLCWHYKTTINKLKTILKKSTVQDGSPSMKPFFQKSIKWILCWSFLIVIVVIWQNWLVSKHLALTEADIERGDLEAAKTSLAAISPFAGSWFLPATRSARIFGLQCDLALTLNDLATGLELQKREYEMLGIVDLQLGSSISAEQIWKDRDGATEWAESFKEYRNSPDPNIPLDDRDLLPEPLIPLPEDHNAWPLTEDIESFKERQHDLAGLISVWLNEGRDTAGMSALLSKLNSDLAILREAARKPGWQPPTRDLEGNIPDCARLLLIDFIRAAEQGDFEHSASALEDHCQFVDNLKGQPSIAQLLISTAMREVLLNVLEHSLDRISFPDPTLSRIANALSGSAMKASFPSDCIRFSYADMKQLLTTSMLETSDGHSTDPVAPHLLSVTLRKVYHDHKVLADSLAPEAISQDPSIESSTDSKEKMASAILKLRRSFSEVFYGEGVLTKEQGRDAASLMLECIAENTASAGRVHLGRIQASIRDQWDREKALLQKIKVLRD